MGCETPLLTDDGALGCGWNVEKLSRKGTVPITISIGTLKLKDKAPGLTTNLTRKKRKQELDVTTYACQYFKMVESGNLEIISKINNGTMMKIGWCHGRHNN